VTAFGEAKLGRKNIVDVRRVIRWVRARTLPNRCGFWMQWTTAGLTCSWLNVTNSGYCVALIHLKILLFSGIAFYRTLIKYKPGLEVICQIWIRFQNAFYRTNSVADDYLKFANNSRTPHKWKLFSKSCILKWNACIFKMRYLRSLIPSLSRCAFVGGRNRNYTIFVLRWPKPT
jgi:hypothetical protein